MQSGKWKMENAKCKIEVSTESTIEILIVGVGVLDDPLCDDHLR